jgi:hypothetical protein
MEESFRGTKNSVEIEMLITLFEKTHEDGYPRTSAVLA